MKHTGLVAFAIFTLVLNADCYMSEDNLQLFPYAKPKRASNLGGRLMCQLDSRNCAAFNVGKKFVGYSWLRGSDLRVRRDYDLRSGAYINPAYFNKLLAARSPRQPEKWYEKY